MTSNCCETEKSKQKLARTTEFLKVVAEENRLKILCILKKHELCVCEIWQQLDLPQNLTSHHLKVLKDFDLVDSKKEGTKVIYFLNSRTIKKYYSLLSRYLS
ncbi:MAG: metalloregulator ArsR/SmtB family transcription factor [Candidatus Moranbacteria bacterium]|nr:metalloregulator ArsR/SmtB family transcription factor [Candidatus Moranbacteria bacterium]